MAGLKRNPGFAYENNSTEAKISFKSYDINALLPTLNWEYRDQYHSIQAQWQLIPTLSSLYVGGGWIWRSRNFDVVKTHQQGPTIAVNFIDYTMSGAQISPEGGLGITTSYTQYLKNENWQGIDQWDYFLTKYFSKGLPSRHAIMTKLQGRYIVGDKPGPTSAHSRIPPTPELTRSTVCNSWFSYRTISRIHNE